MNAPSLVSVFSIYSIKKLTCIFFSFSFLFIFSFLLRLLCGNLLFLFIFYFRQRRLVGSSMYIFIFQLIWFCCCMPFPLCARNMKLYDTQSRRLSIYNDRSIVVYTFSWLVLYYCLMSPFKHHFFWFYLEQQRLEHISHLKQTEY